MTRAYSGPGPRPCPQDGPALVGKTAKLKQQDDGESAEIPAITATTLLVAALPGASQYGILPPRR